MTEGQIWGFRDLEMAEQRRDKATATTTIHNDEDSRFCPSAGSTITAQLPDRGTELGSDSASASLPAP